MGVAAKVDAIHASLKSRIGKGAGQLKLRLVQPEYTIATSDGIRNGTREIRYSIIGREVILERCLRHRVDMLASIMRQAIGSSSKPSLSATDLLKAACGATAASFMVQVEELVPLVDAKNQGRVADKTAGLIPAKRGFIDR